MNCINLVTQILMMKRLLQVMECIKPLSLFQKLEFWLSTGLYILVSIAIISEEPNRESYFMGVNYLYDILVVTTLYFSFLLLSLVVIPRIKLREALWSNIVIIAFIIGGSFAFYSLQDLNFLLLYLSGYFILRFILKFLWLRFRVLREEKGRFYTSILLALLFYVMFMFVLIAGQTAHIAVFIPGILIPFSIFIYGYSYLVLIPASLGKKHPFRNYLQKVFLILLISAVPLGLVGLILMQDEEIPFVMNMINLILQLLITIPLAWFTFKRHVKGTEEVKTLQKELGQSTAKFDFLRSQINPHFLFNALNTLYGTAIQEKAVRTSEGIQQLGDMMRFMLHENMQEKISLAREVEYLKNYINLQKLRTDPNPDIVIQTEIHEVEYYPQISPMLLIPFVENAFKHGISLREPSHINVTLEKTGDIIHFDVYNSKHSKLENDPEKDKSGIGLLNVKQRLKLLYPEKHELIIRETSRQFFVHLTLDLS